MIFDKFENAHLYRSLNTGIAKAFDMIEKTDFSKYLPGKYTIEGEELFVLVNEYETKAAIGNYPEAHKKYVDIQLMLSGAELIGYTPLLNQPVKEVYNEKNDIAFFEAEVDYLQLKTGMFAIFFSNDLHMPGIFIEKPAFVKKIVFKVNTNYFV